MAQAKGKSEAPKLTIKLHGGTIPAGADMTRLINTEVEARKAWYATHDTGTPRRPYTPAQRAALRSLEKAKAALVASTGEPNFKAAVAALGYAPQYAPRVRLA